MGRYLPKGKKAQETLPKNSEIFQKENKKEFYRKSRKNGKIESRITRMNADKMNCKDCKSSAIALATAGDFGGCRLQLGSGYLFINRQSEIGNRQLFGWLTLSPQSDIYQSIIDRRVTISPIRIYLSYIKTSALIRVICG